ncbi:MAG: DUF3006 domain-containing protein [Oscillospiraceae bacterium]|nr:DUF3006 domain-containing protein [Oscillospiraceae bacterium]
MLSIDRFEGEVVICEDECQNKVTLSHREIPQGAKEGDILVKDDRGIWKIDSQTTNKRRTSLFERLCKLENK